MDDLLLGFLLASHAVISADSTSFTYELADVPATHAYGPVSYAGKDYEGVVQIENNVIELLPQAVPLPAAGVVTSGGKDFGPNYVFQQVSVRENLIRYPDNAVDYGSTTFGWSLAVSCNNCDTLLIENNVFALERLAPIHFNLSGKVSCVNNRTPQGRILNANNTAKGEASNDPAAPVVPDQLVNIYFPVAEDALTLSFL